MRHHAASYWALLCAATVACAPPPSQPSATPDDTAKAATEPPATTNEPPPAPSPCGTTDATFDDLAWIPGDVRLLLMVQPQATDLVATLAAVVALARERGADLPVQAAFVLSQLDWEVPSVIDVAQQLGLAPAHIVRLSSPQGASAWVVPSSCSTDVLMQRIRAQTRWALRIRSRPGTLVAVPDPDSGFPFAVVELTRDRIAFVPVWALDDLLAWLVARPVPASLADTAPTPAERLERLAPAPVRAVLGAAPSLSARDPARAIDALRATGNDIETFTEDATVPPP